MTFGLPIEDDIPLPTKRRGITVKSAIAKGADGEREVLAAIRDIMRNVEEELTKDGLAFVARSEFTTRKRKEKGTSSRDIGNVPLISIEVKRHENLNINSAWQQAVQQATPDKLLPVLVYRRNREAWRVRTWLAFIGPDGSFVSYCVATVALPDFLAFYATIYRAFLKQGIINHEQG